MKILTKTVTCTTRCPISKKLTALLSHLKFLLLWLSLSRSIMGPVSFWTVKNSSLKWKFQTKKLSFQKESILIFGNNWFRLLFVTFTSYFVWKEKWELRVPGRSTKYAESFHATYCIEIKGSNRSFMIAFEDVWHTPCINISTSAKK